MEAIARVVHSKSVLMFAMRSCPFHVNISSAPSVYTKAPTTSLTLSHSFVDCGDRAQPKQKARPALELIPNPA